MTSSKTKAAAAGLAVLLCAAVGAPASADTGDTTAYTRTAFQQDVAVIQGLGVIGVQGRVVTGGGWDWVATSGTADTATGRPVPSEGRYRIASNTKTFTAVVLLQLVGEGRLRLDDPVERHLPGLIPHVGERITVRHLLQHTSGLPDYGAPLHGFTEESFQRHRYDHHEPRDLVALALTRPHGFEPGTEWRYSNTGYVVAGLVVEAVTGAPWAREVERRIIRPLGLHGTGVPADDPRLPRPHARAYQQWGLGGPLTDTTEFNTSSSYAAGGIVSTTRDVTTFFRALLAGRLLRPAEQAELLRTVPADGLDYGLGLYRKPLSCGGFYYDHGGNTTGTISRGGVSPDGRRSVALAYTGAHGDSREDIAKLQATSDAVVDRVFCGRE
jgi:D-alanyl-D-alanine carboxypeptidase